MLRSFTLSLALSVVAGLAAQNARNLLIHFPLASAELSGSDVASLRALCEDVDGHTLTGLTLKGHTDVRGSVAYNEA